MNKSIKLFVLEGEKRDCRFFDEMNNGLFKGRYKIETICLPVSQNMYMLYQTLVEDDFETDIVQIIKDKVDGAKEKLDGINRQDIDEVYLFFDLDYHQDNLKTENGIEIIRKLLDVFNNETENGKLYISYPMIEALYDYKPGKCDAFSSCFLNPNIGEKYKELSGNNNNIASHKLTFEKWKEILNTFPLRVKCLFDMDTIDFESYRKTVSPHSIFDRETELIDSKELLFVLSALPEFVYDYFKNDFWNSMSKTKNYKYDTCSKTKNHSS